ncbi:putative F-box/LRR-repeat protein At3g28410 [Oryza brachyantha]|uniref:putative F-box/LRR-repeat protein At3g28410 n=1 Tax=Oryza brachyantha TaxID=4533 RepID=UPI0003EA9736|nr:putative F-box/LRR-repeat protein At3g28410 [Oryza brachyantha]
MAYVQGGDGGERASRCRGRRSGRGYQGPDLISSLPDDLLYHILSFVTTPEAVRTSALSRRWTGVWTRVPRLLLLDEESKDVDRMLDSFDGVLRRYATDVDIADLTISYHWDCPEVTEERATSWAGFAARRVTGRFDLSVKVQSAGTDEHFLELPWFERTAEISLDMSGMRVQLPPAAAAGNFTRLTKLQMSHLLFMDGGGGEGISDVVSRRCPRLETLELEHIDDVEALSLSSESLLCLRLVSLFPLRRLDLEAANLRRMQLEDCFAGHGGWNGGTAMRLSTPVLEEVVWEDEYPDVVEVVRLPTCLKQLAVRGIGNRILLRFWSFSHGLMF